jgi:hypothetical protein
MRRYSAFFAVPEMPQRQERSLPWAAPATQQLSHSMANREGSAKHVINRPE